MHAYMYIRVAFNALQEDDGQDIHHHGLSGPGSSSTVTDQLQAWTGRTSSWT